MNFATSSRVINSISRYDVQGDYHYHDESPFKSLPRRTHHHPPIYNYDYGPLVTPRPTYVVPTPQTTPKRKFQHFPERPKSSHGGSIEEAKRMIYPPDHDQQRISELPAVKKQQRFPPQPPPPPSRQENFYPLPHPPPRVQDEEEIYYPLPRVEKDVSLRHHYRHQTSSRYREEDSASGSKGERFHNSNDLQLYFPKHHQVKKRHKILTYKHGNSHSYLQRHRRSLSPNSCCFSSSWGDEVQKMTILDHLK